MLFSQVWYRGGRKCTWELGPMTQQLSAQLSSASFSLFLRHGVSNRLTAELVTVDGWGSNVQAPTIRYTPPLFFKLSTPSPIAPLRIMKLLTIASAFLATASAGSLFGGPSEVVFDDSLSVPGNNPLSHCEDPKNDILDLKSVDLNPNPPKA